ncbi:hypothetical protein ACSBR1_020940 [Camellia fascicularis]
MRVESVLYGALAERWWDTTDSFHFSSTGEMTLTPYDFSVLTGLESELVALSYLTQIWCNGELHSSNFLEQSRTSAVRGWCATASSTITSSTVSQLL